MPIKQEVWVPAVFGIAGAIIGAATPLIIAAAQVNATENAHNREIRSESYDAALSAQKALHGVIKAWKDCEAALADGVDPISGVPVDPTTLNCPQKMEVIGINEELRNQAAERVELTGTTEATEAYGAWSDALDNYLRSSAPSEADMVEPARKRFVVIYRCDTQNAC